MTRLLAILCLTFALAGCSSFGAGCTPQTENLCVRMG